VLETAGTHKSATKIPLYTNLVGWMCGHCDFGVGLNVSNAVNWAEPGAKSIVKSIKNFIALNQSLMRCLCRRVTSRNIDAV